MWTSPLTRLLGTGSRGHTAATHFFKPGSGRRQEAVHRPDCLIQDASEEHASSQHVALMEACPSDWPVCRPPCIPPTNRHAVNPGIQRHFLYHRGDISHTAGITHCIHDNTYLHLHHIHSVPSPRPDECCDCVWISQNAAGVTLTCDAFRRCSAKTDTVLRLSSVLVELRGGTERRRRRGPAESDHSLPPAA